MLPLCFVVNPLPVFIAASFKVENTWECVSVIMCLREYLEDVGSVLRTVGPHSVPRSPE